MISEIEQRWYLHIADQTYGPYTSDQIRLIAAKNQIVENEEHGRPLLNPGVWQCHPRLSDFGISFKNKCGWRTSISP
jgi:hypothetical protein